MSPTKKEERDAKDSSTSSLEEEIAQTRSSMSQTIGELHGKLNPGVFKDQVLDQFHEAKESIKADLMEAKNAIKADLKTELAEVKTGLRNELREAKQEFRDATIGRVETMVQNAQEKVTDTSRSLLQVLSDNPIDRCRRSWIGVALHQCACPLPRQFRIVTDLFERTRAVGWSRGRLCATRCGITSARRKTNCKKPLEPG